MRKKIKMGKAWRRIFAMMLAMAIISTAVPVDVRGDNGEEEENIMALSENDLMEVNGAFDDGTEDALWDEGAWEDDYTNVSDMTANANDMSAIEMPETTTYATADEGANRPMPIAGQMDLLDPSTSVETVDIIFIATWTDENGQVHQVTTSMKDSSEIEFPSNADIYVQFEFQLKNKDRVSSDTRYHYEIPDGITVDLGEIGNEIDLNYGGKKVGTAIIGDGYIDFIFDSDVLDDDDIIPPIGLEVHFDGSLNSNGVDEDGNLDLEFPSSSGGWDVNGKVTEPEEADKTVSQAKWGREGIDEKTGKRYIEWTVYLKPNYDGPLDGVIKDTLPPGLTWDGGDITLSNAKGKTTLDSSHVSVDSQGNLTITINEADGIQRADEWNSIGFTFRTVLDDETFDKITNEGIKFNNKADYIPDDPDIKTKDKAESTVTVRPDVLKKGNLGMSGDVITWTVTINAEGMDIGGTVYTDTFGDWADMEEFDINSIQWSPAGIKDKIKSVRKTANGFVIEFPDDFTDTVTLTYQTTVKDEAGKSYTNKGELDGDHFDVDVSDTVTRKDWIQKAGTNYNKVTQIISWDITVHAGDDILTDVTILENFNETVSQWINGQNVTSPQVFEFVRAYVGDRELTPGTGDYHYQDKGGNQYEFYFDEITGEFVIHVELKITDEWLQWEKDNGLENSWWTFKNNTHLNATKKDDNKKIDEPATGTYSPGQIQDTELVSKSGEVVGDGTIRWTIRVYNYDVAKESMVVRDVLGSDQEYIKGSLYVKPNFWTPEGNYYPEEHGEVIWNGNELNYVIYENNEFVAKFPREWAEYYNDYNNWFEIVFLTKPTSLDAAEKGNYKNTASVDVTYANGNGSDKDEATATVTDPAEGILKKEGVGQGEVVLWTVTVNEGHYNLGDQPSTIKDQLAEYFHYDSGTVYRVDENGNKTEIPQGDPGPKDGKHCYVTVVNNELVVQLPAIGTDTIIFEFYTTITVSNAILQGYLPIVNEVEFKGETTRKDAKSGEVQGVQVSGAGGSSYFSEGIRIVKVDESGNGTIFLPGAEFELYLGDLSLGTIVTGEDGMGLFSLNLKRFEGLTLRLKEIKPPTGYSTDNAGYPDGDGYRWDEDEKVFYITVTSEMAQKNILEITVTNETEKEIVRTGEISLKKIDAEDASHVLRNARFGLYEDSACTKSAAAPQYTTSEGEIKFSGLQPGTYYLKELQSPEGFILPKDLIIEVVISEDLEYSYRLVSGTDEVISFDEGRFVIANKQPKGKLIITKVDANGITITTGEAEFALYEDSEGRNEVARKTTVNGVVTFDGLEYGKEYYYQETIAPDGYALDDEIKGPVSVGKKTDRNDGQQIEISVKNVKEEGNLIIYKEGENGNALIGVEFELYYLDENGGEHPYPDAEHQLTATTVRSGSAAKATFSGLPFGRYRVKEKNGLAGYDVNVYRDVEIKATGDTSITIENELLEATIRIIKYGSNQDSASPADGNPLGNASFELVDISTGRSVTARMTTGEDGKCTFVDIPYGDYHVVETYVPSGYQRYQDASAEGCKYPNCVAHINKADFDEASDSPQIEISRTLDNKKENGKILLLKTGSTSGDEGYYGLSGARFNLLDENRNIIKTGISGTIDAGIDLETLIGYFDTDNITGAEAGLLYFDGLEYGTYYLQEASPALGYLGDLHEWKIVVTGEEIVVVYAAIRDIASDPNDPNAWKKSDSPLVINNVKREAPFISAKLLKVYDKDGNPDTVNDRGSLEGAVFGFYKDKNDGKGWVLDSTWTSDKDGIVYFERIEIKGDPTGTQYAIKEISAPAGYDVIYKDYIVLGAKGDKDIENYADGDLDEDKPEEERDFLDPKDYGWVKAANALPSDLAPAESTVPNKVIYGSAQIIKTNARTGRRLGGAVFTLYYDEACNYPVGSGGTAEYKLKDAMLGGDFKNSLKTDSTGMVEFKGLPQGTYYVKETQAPDGYLKSNEVRKIVVVTAGDVVNVPKETFTDQEISIQISKRTVDGTELPGATFTLYKLGTGGEEKAIWTMNGEGDIKSATKTIPSNLLELYNENRQPQMYYLKETHAPKGYVAAQEAIVFTINEDGTINIIRPTDSDYVKTDDGGKTLVVIDKPIDLTIRKQDEDGNLLPGATLALYQVTESNGVRTETLVHRFTTTKRAYTLSSVGVIEIPEPDVLLNSSKRTSITYVLREESAPSGYDLAEDIEFKVYSDGSIEWGNNRTNVITMVDQRQSSFYFQKVDENGKELAGATFQLYEINGENDRTRKVGSDAFYSQWTDNALHKIEAGRSGDPSEMLLLGHYYALEEMTPPEGYLLPVTSILYFTVEEQNGQLRMRLLNGSNRNINSDGTRIIMRDERLSLYIRKEDAFANPLEGAQLVICKYIEGKDVNDWPRVSNPFNSRDVEKMDFIAEHPEAQLETGSETENVYALVEITHPDNYRDADPILFYIAKSGVVVRLDREEVADNTIVMLDESKGVGIAKRDIADHNYLAGCTLEISSLDDEFFRVNPATWTSGENDQTWTFDMGVFYPGKTYILSELEAPDGYAYTDPIYFTIGSDNQVYVDGEPQPGNIVYIEDGKIRLGVSKQDKYTGEEVPGALLGLYRLEEDGSETQMVAPWRTGTGPLSLNTASMTTTGEGYVEYILRELEAPEGYYKADDIHFALDRDGKVYMVTQAEDGGEKNYTLYNGTTLIMREEPKFSVRKMDTDGNYVAGATLQITAKDDPDFETITWDTTDAPKVFDLLDSGENPFKEGVTYVLKELKAPNGYKVAESIEFTIKAGKLIVNGEQVDNMRVVMLDYKVDEPAKDGATNTPGQSKDPGKAPKTGDDTPLAMLLLLCITGLLGAISSFVKYIIWKRKHRVYD